MGKKGLGFLNKRHCEKTSYITVAGIIALGILVVSMLKGVPVPNVNINGVDYSYFVIAGLVVLGGYIGVLYYRYANNKKPLFKPDFWNAT